MQLQPNISANEKAFNEGFLVRKRKFLFNNLLLHFRDYKAEWVSPVQVEKKSETIKVTI